MQIVGYINTIVSDRNCRDNQNTHFLFNNFSFSKIVLLMRLCGKMWYSRTCHWWRCKMAHALCVLDNNRFRYTLGIRNSYCFPRKHWLYERASMLRPAYIACLVWAVRFITSVSSSWVSPYFYTVCWAEFSFHSQVTMSTIFHTSQDIDINADMFRKVRHQSNFS